MAIWATNSPPFKTYIQRRENFSLYSPSTIHLHPNIEWLWVPLVEDNLIEFIKTKPWHAFKRPCYSSNTWLINLKVAFIRVLIHPWGMISLNCSSVTGRNVFLGHLYQTQLTETGLYEDNRSLQLKKNSQIYMWFYQFLVNYLILAPRSIIGFLY